MYRRLLQLKETFLCTVTAVAVARRRAGSLYIRIYRRNGDRVLRAKIVNKKRRTIPGDSSNSFVSRDSGP